jgi:hypothetical protein
VNVLLLAIDWLQVRLERLREWVLDRAAVANLACVDCNANTAAIGEYYMVWPDVWAKSGLASDDGMLCIGCLEQRLGRRLAMHDFTAAPVNFEHVGSRLRERLFE